MRRVLVLGGGLWVLLIASLAFNIGFGSTVAVQKVRRCNRPCAEAGVCEMRLFSALNLTEDQRRHLEQMQAELTGQIAALRSELAAERGRLGDLLAADEPDDSAITGQLDRIAAVQRRVQESVVVHLLAMRGQLSDEQRAAFDSVIRERICPCGGGKACELHQAESGACPRAEEQP